MLSRRRGLFDLEIFRGFSDTESKKLIMVTGVGATMPTGGVTVGATPPAQHVPQEAGQPPAQTTPTTTTTTRRSGENRRVSVS